MTFHECDLLGVRCSTVTGMDPDEEDAMILRGLALAAAVLVGFGSGRPPEAVIGEAREYEAYLLGGVTPET